MEYLDKTSEKYKVLEQIVNAIKGDEVKNIKTTSELNEWLMKIANSIITGGGSGVSDYNKLENVPITSVINMDANNPFVLKTLASGVYLLHGYFKANEVTTNKIVAQVPMMASVSTSSTKSFIQLFFAYNNQIQYLEITDEDYTMTNFSLTNLASRIEALESKVQ